MRLQRSWLEVIRIKQDLAIKKNLIPHSEFQHTYTTDRLQYSVRC